MLKTSPYNHALYQKMKSAIAIYKSIEQVENLLSSDPSLANMIGANGSSMLQTAFCFFNLKIMKLLILNGADIKYRDNKGFTVLTSALFESNVEAITLLLQAGAVVDDNHPKDKQAKALAIKKNPAIADLLAKAERHELEPISFSPPLARSRSGLLDASQDIPVPLTLSVSERLIPSAANVPSGADDLTPSPIADSSARASHFPASSKADSSEDEREKQQTSSDKEQHLTGGMEAPSFIANSFLITPTIAQQSATTVNRYGLFGTLKQRLIPDSKKVNLTSGIEMTDRNTAPTLSALAKNLHID